MRKLLDIEGPVIGFLEKGGQLIVLSVLWLLGCIPVITACASTAALYETVRLTVREEQGSAAKNFWAAFKRCLPSGILLTLLLLAGFAIPEGICILVLRSTYPGGLLGGVMVLNAFVCLYAPAVLATFGQGAAVTWKRAFVLSLQFAHYTLLLLLGTVSLALLQIYVFPMGLCLVLPGAWCWCSSFLLERAMGRGAGKRNETK